MPSCETKAARSRAWPPSSDGRQRPRRNTSTPWSRSGPLGKATRSLGAIPEHAVAVEPAAQWALSQRVDRDDCLEHRHLDARGGCRLVDDLALLVAGDGGARG